MNRHFFLGHANRSGALRHILALTALGLLASPSMSHADGSQKAIDACVQAFVAANLPKEQRVIVDKQSIASGLLDERAGTYRISLAAVGATSGRQIAKGTCIADRKGEVLRLHGRRPAQTVQTASAMNAAR